MSEKYIHFFLKTLLLNILYIVDYISYIFFVIFFFNLFTTIDNTSKTAVKSAMVLYRSVAVVNYILCLFDSRKSSQTTSSQPQVIRLCSHKV